MEDFKGDKRTKAYRDFKEKYESNPIEASSGLGDAVEKVLKVTGVDKVVKWIAGDDCNCQERKEKLNAMFTYKILCLNETEFNYLDNFFKGNPKQVKPSEYVELTKIASRITNRRIQASMSCGGCVRKVVEQLKQIYTTYEN